MLLNVLLNCVHDHTLQTDTDLLVVSNQLSLYMSRHQVNSSQHLTCLQPPDGAGGVDAGGACGGGGMQSAKQINQQPSWLVHWIGMLTQKIGINFIPVKRGEWGTEIGILVVI